MDGPARALTTQFSKVESDIHQAAHDLELAFSAANKRAKDSRNPEIPDPINLIRRLTALEVAMKSLNTDCEIVSKKRAEIVHKVLTTQLEATLKVKKMLDQTEDADPYTSSDDIIDESWNSITQTLEKQHFYLSQTRDCKANTNTKQNSIVD